jgi:hypothetical protein
MYVAELQYVLPLSFQDNAHIPNSLKMISSLLDDELIYNCIVSQ